MLRIKPEFTYVDGQKVLAVVVEATIAGEEADMHIKATSMLNVRDLQNAKHPELLVERFFDHIDKALFRAQMTGEEDLEIRDRIAFEKRTDQGKDTP